MARRTSVVIDEDLVDSARTILGTKGIKDTIDVALTEVIRAERRRRLVERFRTGTGMDHGAIVEARSSWATDDRLSR